MSKTETLPSQAAEHAPEQIVRCLAVPINTATLLLPHTAVAEVAQYQVPQPVAEAPPWLLGLIPWRGRTLPLIAIEPLFQLEVGAPAPASRVVVCNTLNGNRKLPFLGVFAQGIPRLQLATATTVEAGDGGHPEPPALLARVRLAGQEMLVPDLDALEKMLLQTGVSTE